MAKARKMTLQITSSPKEPFDARRVPENELRGFARATLRAVERFFESPGVQEDFERWLREDYSKRPGVELSEVYRNG